MTTSPGRVRPMVLLSLAAGLLASVATFLLIHQKVTDNGGGKEGPAMKLTHVCLVTRDLPRLRAFYAAVLQVKPKVYQEDYLEFILEGAILSLYHEDAMDKTAPGAMRAGANRSLLVEFQVAEVDREYSRLKALEPPVEWVMPPTTFPWGNRSIYFRDPEGNLLNFYSVVK